MTRGDRACDSPLDTLMDSGERPESIWREIASIDATAPAPPPGCVPLRGRGSGGVTPGYGPAALRAGIRFACECSSDSDAGIGGRYAHPTRAGKNPVTSGRFLKVGGLRKSLCTGLRARLGCASHA